jgi:hypothetical protein
MLFDIAQVNNRFFSKLDEDIPYVQYPSKQQQQQLHVDESISTNVVEVSAPLVVKLPGDEPLPTTSIVVSHPQPLVSGIYLYFPEIYLEFLF